MKNGSVDCCALQDLRRRVMSGRCEEDGHIVHSGCTGCTLVMASRHDLGTGLTCGAGSVSPAARVVCTMHHETSKALRSVDDAHLAGPQ